jgi:hypothetical protein
VVLLAGGVVTAQAQTVEELPEIARRLRAARRPATPGTVRIFTNDTLNGSDGRLNAGARGIASDATADGAGANNANSLTNESEGPTAGGMIESEWRARFANAREEITRAQDRASLAEQDLQNLNRRLLTETSLFNREGQLLPQITEQEGVLEDARARVAEARQALEDLTTELRRAGGPPGWAR